MVGIKADDVSLLHQILSPRAPLQSAELFTENRRLE